MKMTMGGRREQTGVDDLAQRRKELREARVKAARSQSNWAEITPAERLIPRGPTRFGWLCDVPSDRLFSVGRGSVFQPGTANVVATHVPVVYFVNRDGDVIALEPAPVATWSEVVRQRPDLVTTAS